MDLFLRIYFAMLYYYSCTNIVRKSPILTSLLYKLKLKKTWLAPSRRRRRQP